MIDIAITGVTYKSVIDDSYCKQEIEPSLGMPQGRNTPTRYAATVTTMINHQKIRTPDIESFGKMIAED